MALIGCAHALEKEGRHLITTKIEHPAIGKAMQHLEKEGFEVTYLPVDSFGRISMTDLRAALRPDTILVSIMMVNNEMGAVEPLSQAGSVIAEFNRANHASVLFHTDAVQGYGKLPIDVKGWKIDLLSVSAHKCNGPKGVGFLYIKEGMRIKPLLYGGGQQGGLRSGTLNVPGIAGMGLAAEKAYASLDRNVTFLYDLKSYFCKKIKENLDDIRVNGSCFWDGDTASFEKEKWKEAPHILSLSVRGVRAEVLLHALEDKGIYVSAGSACSTNHPTAGGLIRVNDTPQHVARNHQTGVGYGGGCSIGDRSGIAKIHPEVRGCCMDYHAFIIKYAEIGLKGKNRNYFEEALVSRMKKVLSDCEGNFHISRVAGRIYVEAGGFDFEEVISALKRVFGITGICPAVTYERDGDAKLPELGALGKLAAQYMKQVYPDGGASFKVKCRRVDKTYPQDSMEVDAALGEAILVAFNGSAENPQKGTELAPGQMRVDVHQPEIVLHVELREKVNFFSQEIKGPGGMPTGSSGRAMLLLSGGIDSPVAGYLIARRGAEVDAVYFHAPPYTSDRAKQKVVDLAGILAGYTGGVRLHVVNFTEIQLYIYEKCPHEELTIIMRRYMMRIADRIAGEEKMLGLITGESIAQVASQTMQSLMATDEVVRDMPVYRPLIGFDKQDIVDISLKIGAYETSIQPYEDCCTIFVAKHPATKPKCEVIRKHEENLGEKIDEMVDRAIREREIIEV